MSTRRRYEPRPIRLLQGVYNGPSIYTVCDTVETLARMGACRIDPGLKRGISFDGLGMFSARQSKSGMAAVKIYAEKLMSADTRFQYAMHHVLTGAPCPDFSLPPAPKRKRLDRGDCAEGTS